MYKPSTYLPSCYLPPYLSTYIWDQFATELVTKVKPNITSVKVHPQLSDNEHPVDWKDLKKKFFLINFSLDS
jgi:hypothetical protein